MNKKNSAIISKVNKNKLSKFEKSNELSPFIISQISEKFKQNGWIMEEDNKCGLFNRFCHMLKIFNEVEQLFIIELIDRYLIVHWQEYIELFKKNFKLFSEQFPYIKYPNINIMPLIAKEDLGKAKSSTYLFYSLKSYELKYDILFNNYNIKFIGTREELSRKIDKKQGDMIILIDDFIGSGETAISAINHLTEGFPETIKKKIIVQSLVGQSEGIERIKELGICVICAIVRNKGISDYYSNEQIEYKLKTMNDMEEKIKVKEELHLGYAKSEALVTLLRTPNNTFPVFWYENGNYIAPFPRK